MKKTFYARLILGILLALLFTINQKPSAASDNSFELNLIHTNDTHGNFQEPFDAGETLLRLTKGARKDLTNKNAHLLTLDAGDITSYRDPSIDTLESDLRALDAAGYNAMAIGNHEIDFGLAKFYELTQKIKMPVLCANIIDNKTKRHLFKPYIIKKFEGVRIAIIGITSSNLYAALSAEEKSSFGFLGTNEAYFSVITDVKRKADMIFILSHLGLNDDREFAKAHPEVSLIIGAHSHTFLKQSELVGGTFILNAGKFGDCLGQTKITIKDKKIVSANENLIYLKKTF